MQIDLSGQMFDFGQLCACCHNVADTRLAVAASRSSGKRKIHTRTNVWQIPYCKSCMAHFSMLDLTRSNARWLTLFSLLAGAVCWFAIHPLVGTVVGIGALTGTIFFFNKQMTQARSLRRAECACLDRAVAYLSWFGTVHQFDVVSRQFAADVMLLNVRKLVNVSPQARAVLDSVTLTVNTTGLQSPRKYIG
jgi:hypothetical protein